MTITLHHFYTLNSNHSRTSFSTPILPCSRFCAVGVMHEWIIILMPKDRLLEKSY